MDLPFQVTGAGAAYEGIARLPVAVLLDNVRSLYNVGAFFRTRMPPRIEKLYLCGITGLPPKKGHRQDGAGRGGDGAWEHAWEPLELVRRLRGRGYEIAAVETALHAVDLFDWAPRFPVAWSSGTKWRASARRFRRCATPTCAFPCWAQTFPQRGHRRRSGDLRTAAQVPRASIAAIP